MSGAAGNLHSSCSPDSPAALWTSLWAPGLAGSVIWNHYPPVSSRVSDWCHVVWFLWNILETLALPILHSLYLWLRRSHRFHSGVRLYVSVVPSLKNNDMFTLWGKGIRLECILQDNFICYNLLLRMPGYQDCVRVYYAIKMVWRFKTLTILCSLLLFKDPLIG